MSIYVDPEARRLDALAEGAYRVVEILLGKMVDAERECDFARLKGLREAYSLAHNEAHHLARMAALTNDGELDAAKHCAWQWWSEARRP